MVRRAALVATVAVALAGSLTSVAGAAQVTVVPPRGGAPVTLTSAQLEAEKTDQEYTFSGARATRAGVTLDRLIEIADAGPTYGYAEIDGSVRLSKKQVTGGDPLPGGSPFVYWDDQGMHFVRPDGEDGSQDQVSGASVTVTLRDGSPIDVQIDASRTRIKPGQKVSFRASVDSKGAGQGLDFSWTIRGVGTSSRAESFTHRFEKRGQYDVSLGVTAVGDATGGDDIVRIVVGKPSSEGPDRKGGGDDPDGDADSGNIEGDGDTTAEGGSSSALPPAEDPAPPAPKRPAQREDAEPEPEPIGPDDIVRGSLLANLPSTAPSPRSPLGEALRSALRTGTPSTAAATTNVPAAAWSLGGTLFLLGLGAGWELRQSRRAGRPGRRA